jgi:hypothetical protein
MIMKIRNHRGEDTWLPLYRFSGRETMKTRGLTVNIRPEKRKRRPPLAKVAISAEPFAAIY